MNLQDCLPAELRGPATAITRIAAGLSGAGVYRVEADGRLLVLKVSDASEPLASWRAKVEIRRRAGDAGLAPAVVHIDEVQRAVVSAFVQDRSFPMLYGDPRTRDAAVALLGRTLRRVHELPVPLDAEAKEPRAMLAAQRDELASFALPAFVTAAVDRALAQPPPPGDRPAVLSHNDVNPTNLVYDGEHLLLLDWDTAGPNDPYFDLATTSVFMLMDEDTCRRLIAAHDDAPVSELPAQFAYDQLVMAALCGTMFLTLARGSGHPGASGGETLDATLSLAEFYPRLRSGELRVGTPEGLWCFGLALIKASAGYRLPSR